MPKTDEQESSKILPIDANEISTGTEGSTKIQNLLSSSNNGYFPKSAGVSSKVGDLANHRPVIQANTGNSSAPASASAFKITQVGPVVGSNVVVSRMDASNIPRTTSASPVPISGPLAPSSNYYFPNNPSNPNSSTVAATNQRPRIPNVNGGSGNISANSNNVNNFYHNTASNVTKFTNMTVANAGSKNPLKPNHYTVPLTSGNSTTNGGGSAAVNLSTHPNSNLSAPNTSGIAPKTTLKASDLIHILPNLFNTLKRRNSNSNIGVPGSNGLPNANSNPGASATNRNGYFGNSGPNSLAAAVAAAASNSGKPLTTSTAAALVAEQLLNVAASGPFSDDSSSSPPPTMPGNLAKKMKLHAGGNSSSHAASSLQCQVCGKIYKHRNCLSKHMWEHHESWEHTKKVCQTKHQQVQLLEAAQVLAEIVCGGSGASRNFDFESNGSAEDDDRFFADQNNYGSDDDDEERDEINEEENDLKFTPHSQEDLRKGQQQKQQEEEADENISIGGEEDQV